MSQQVIYPDNSSAQERRKTGFTVPDGYKIINLISGRFFVTHELGYVITTVLGSCVSACIRDPKLQIGGMNHFLLPGDKQGSESGHTNSTRYGAFAMEELINRIIYLGGVRDRLEVKVFGGANVTDSSVLIGDSNVTFIRNYLSREGMKIMGEDLGGTLPRRVHYYPESGKVMMRKLQRREDMTVVQDEEYYAESLHFRKDSGSVDLF